MSSHTTASGKPRQRAAVACNHCRNKRIKCDSNRPSCTACSEAGTECKYASTEGNRKPPSKRYVEALQERVKNLELLLQHTKPKVAHQPPGEPRGPGNHYDESESESSLKASGRLEAPVRELSDRLGRLNVGEDGQIRFFGSRSNLSLVRNRLTNNSVISLTELRAKANDSLERLGLLVDISVELQQHLLDIFWSWQNNWQVVIIQELFEQDLYVSKTGRYASPLVLSALLALAARYSDRSEVRTDPEDPNTAGDALAEKAKVLLFYESQAPNITTVQEAILLSLRETATDKEALGWLYCGTATRMAFNLGLHLDCTRWIAAGHITQEEAEVRIVVWWGCYMIDKLFNIGLGRPSSIYDPEVTASLPEVLEKQELEPWSATQSVGTRITLPNNHIMTNFNSCCKLLQLASQALDEVYRPRNLLDKAQLASLVAKTQVELLSFYTQLPSCLRLPVSHSNPGLPHAYNLHLQYHVAVILLHRPFIFVKVRNNEPLLKPTDAPTSVHFKECGQSAYAIASIFKQYRKHYTLRRIPISAVHCAFTAATIILFDTMSDNSEKRRRSMSSLEILVIALHDMGTAWAWSRRALSAIGQLAGEWSLGEDVQHVLNMRLSCQDSSRQNDPCEDFLSYIPQDPMVVDTNWLFGDLGNGYDLEGLPIFTDFEYGIPLETVDSNIR